MQFKKTSIFQAESAHLQLLLGKLSYLSSKGTTFEHTSCITNGFKLKVVHFIDLYVTKGLPVI